MFIWFCFYQLEQFWTHASDTYTSVDVHTSFKDIGAVNYTELQMGIGLLLESVDAEYDTKEILGDAGRLAEYVDIYA